MLICHNCNEPIMSATVPGLPDEFRKFEERARDRYKICPKCGKSPWRRLNDEKQRDSLKIEETGIDRIPEDK